MDVAYQTSLTRAVTIAGVALHSGKQTTMTLRPAPADAGIVWRRVDLSGWPTIAARPEHIVDTVRSTVLGRHGAVVRTVEHVMAALAGMRIDNCLIDIDGEEPPVGDGSSLSFVRLIESAGVSTLPSLRQYFTLTEPRHVWLGNASLIALPYDGFHISCVFVNDHGHPALGDQFAEFDIDPATFRDHIAPARTMGYTWEIEQLQKNGLGLGGNLETVVLISEKRIESPLRFPNEPVRHKVLDLLGDLALLGPMQARIVALRPSHRLNAQLTQALAPLRNAYVGVADM